MDSLQTITLMSAKSFERPQELWDELTSQVNKILLSISRTTTLLFVHPASCNTSRVALTAEMSTPMYSLHDTNSENIALIVPSFKNKAPPQATLFPIFTPLTQKTEKNYGESSSGLTRINNRKG
ncbi:hypothetical protein V6N13_032151 [Hibiscus sabdariffa]